MDWIYLKDKQPKTNQICYCCDENNDVYLCRFCNVGLFKRKLKFVNMFGHGWEVTDVVKWQPFIIPKP